MSTVIAGRRTAAAVARPTRTVRRASRHGALPSLFDAAGGEPTLDEVIAGVWEGLTAHRAVDCPVCGAEMEPAYGAHAKPIGGACRSCGSALS
jgi:hypothetical protein